MQALEKKPRATQEERRRDAKRRLQEAALYLFAHEGYDPVTLGAISLKAGFSRTLAQYHYPDKQSLALGLLRDRILRDNHIELLDSGPGTSPEKAWDALMAHLQTLKHYYVALHAGAKPNMRANGEMAIHAAAFISKDSAFRACVEEQSRDQVARIEALLGICRKGGLIPEAADVHGLAILYVQSIWSLAQTLYTSPFARKTIANSFDQLAVLFKALRSNHQVKA